MSVLKEKLHSVQTCSSSDDGDDHDPSHGVSSIWNDPELLAVRIDYMEVRTIKLISRGGFGEVFSGIYLGQPVAVKRLLPNKRTLAEAKAFANEIKIMAK
jgi:hypothetical protein